MYANRRTEGGKLSRKLRARGQGGRADHGMNAQQEKKDSEGPFRGRTNMTEIATRRAVEAGAGDTSAEGHLRR